MTTPYRDRATDWLSDPDPRPAEPPGVRPESVSEGRPVSPICRLGGGQDTSRRGRRTRRPENPSFRVRFRPQVGLLEQRPC